MTENEAVKALESNKDDIERIRKARAELMQRLYNKYGYSYARIGEIYGCSRQYVKAEIERYYPPQEGKVKAWIQQARTYCSTTKSLLLKRDAPQAVNVWPSKLLVASLSKFEK